MTFLWLLALVAAGAFVVLFALFEIAFFASSQIAVRALGEGADEGRALRERLRDPLAVLIPARLGLLAAAAVAAAALDGLGLGSTPAFWIFGIFTPAWFVFREFAPAVILLRDPEDLLPRLLTWFRPWERLARPASEPLRRLLRRWFPLSDEPDEDASDEEVAAFLETGAEEGILEEEEAAMVRGVLELDEMLVREVMTPRPSVVAVASDASRAQVEALIARSRHHRIPVFGPGDRVAGVVDAVDLVSAREGGVRLDPLLREVPVVPETKRVDDLLREFKRTKHTFAVVVDEHASVSGIVTLRDISEEIVGEVRKTPEDAAIMPEKGDSFLVPGGAELDEVARATGFSFPESLNGAAFDTMSGFCLAAWRRIPAAGEVIERDGLVITVVEADERRIRRVRVARARPSAAGPGAPTGAHRGAL